MKVSSSALSLLLTIIPLSGFAAGPGDVSIYGEIKSEAGFRFPDGSLQTSAAGIPVLARKIIVAKSGGDFTSIQAAIDSITNASSVINYLVWVGPGVYREQVVLKEGVHLQGAGQKATRIHRSPLLSEIVVEASDHSTISSIGISCISGQALSCTGLKATDTQYNSLQDVFIEVSLSVKSKAGLASGIGIELSAPTISTAKIDLRNVSVRVHGPNENTGIRSSRYYVTMSDSNIEAVSDTSGDSRALEVTTSHGFNARNSRFVSDGGDSCQGARITGSPSVQFSHSVIESSSDRTGSTCYGIYLADSADLEFNHGTIAVADATNQYGISAVAGSARSIRVTHSKIRAVTYTVANVQNYSIAEFLYTHFDGGAVLDGTNNTFCRYSTDESLAALTTGCP